MTSLKTPIAMCAVFTALLTACSDPPTEPPELMEDAGASQPDVVPDEPESEPDVDLQEDASPEAPPTGPPCTSELSWAPGPDLPVPRDHHATFIYTKADGTSILHVNGGTNYAGVFSDAWEAEILEGGGLGPWAEAQALPAPRAGHAMALVEGEVYLIGGRDLGGFLGSVLRASFDGEGRLSGWEAQPALPGARFHASAATDGRFVWLSGGLGEGNEASDTIFVAESSEGGLGQWRALDPLPEARSHHASFTRAGALYLAYGFSGNPIGNRTDPHLNIIRAEFDEAGSLGDFGVSLIDSMSISTLGITLADGCGFLVAGLIERTQTDFVYNDLVWRVDFDEAGKVTRKSPSLSKLSTGRSHLHHTPFHEGRLYVVSGSQDLQEPTPSVEIGTFIAP